MRCAATIVGLLLVACGCTRASNEAEPAAKAEVSTEAPPPEGFVVLRAGTPLFRRPSAETPSFVFAPRQAGSFDAFRSFAVVGHEGHWIRIRNVRDEAPEKHCVRGWEALQHFEIDLWVREADLQRVTRRSAIAEFGDGTSAMLAAGTPVEQHDASQWIALGLAASARLPLRADAVATFYRPGTLYDPKNHGDRLPSDTKLELGGHPIDTRALVGRDGIAVQERVRRDDGTLVTVGTRCAELKVLARGEVVSIEDIDAEIAAREAALEDLDRSSGRWSFEAGAEVFWDDGEPAGKLVEAHAFDHPPSVDSDRRCFAHAGLTLCLRADRMKTITNDAGW